MDFTSYRPRRARAKWLEGAPSYIVACYDSGDAVADRFTILLGGSEWSPGYAEANYRCGRDPRLLPALALSRYPTDPCGISLYVDAIRGPHLGRKVAWPELPENVRAHIVARIEQE